MNATTDICFKDVRKRFPVEAFFESKMGQTPRVFHTGIRFRECPSCGLSDDPASLRVVIQNHKGISKWRCYACDKSGDVLDAASYRFNCSVKEAAKLLMDDSGLPATVRNWKIKQKKTLSETPRRNDEAIHNVIQNLIDAKLPITNKVKEYLYSRGFSDQLIQEAYRRGVLIALPAHANKAKQALYDLCGEQLLIDAGMLRENSKAPACAFRDFAFITHNAKAIEFRLTRAPRENETKWITYGPMSPFFWQGTKSDSYIVTEGMSDMLSAVALGANQSIIGLPGCKRWNPYWFSRMGGKDVISALDGDLSGTNAANGTATPEEIAAIEDESFRLRAMGLNGTLKHFGAKVRPFKFRDDFLVQAKDSEKDLNGLLKWILKSEGMHQQP